MRTEIAVGAFLRDLGSKNKQAAEEENCIPLLADFNTSFSCYFWPDDGVDDVNSGLIFHSKRVCRKSPPLCFISRSAHKIR